MKGTTGVGRIENRFISKSKQADFGYLVDNTSEGEQTPRLKFGSFSQALAAGASCGYWCRKLWLEETPDRHSGSLSL